MKKIGTMEQWETTLGDHPDELGEGYVKTLSIRRWTDSGNDSFEIHDLLGNGKAINRNILTAKEGRKLFAELQEYFQSVDE